MANSKYFQDIDIQFLEEADDCTKIVAEPFDRGYGVTIGNALRRTLLTSIPGAAITSIKIDGVSHEFTTIDGVLEDDVIGVLFISEDHRVQFPAVYQHAVLLFELRYLAGMSL